MDPRRAVALGREVVAELRANNITFMAGSIAHSAFISLLPLLLLLLIVVSAVGNDVLVERVVDLARSHLSPAGEGLVYEALVNASDRAGTSAIGIVTLVWGMLRIFRGVNTAFGELYGGTDDSLSDQLLDGVVVFTSITVATVGTGVATALLGRSDHPLVAAINPIVLVIGLVVAFFPMFYLFPEPDVSPREALPGAVLAGVGWALLEATFGVYVAFVDTVGTYGLLGAVIVLLVWLYAAAFVLLSAATVNVVLAGRHRGRRDRPDGDDSTDRIAAQ